jgi:hypothetical protein
LTAGEITRPGGIGSVPRSGAEGPLLRGGRSQCLAAADVRGLARPLAFLQQPTTYIRLGSSVLCAARPVMADPLASRAADGADGPPLRRHATHLFIRTPVGHALDGKGVTGDRGNRRTLPGGRSPENASRANGLHALHHAARRRGKSVDIVLPWQRSSWTPGQSATRLEA